jgi:hypothetical protein
LGLAVQCPQCGHEFVAATTPPPASKVPPPDANEPRRRRKYDDDDVESKHRSIHVRRVPHRGGLLVAMGLIAVAGMFLVLPAVFGPIAWLLAMYDLREIHAGRMDPAGERATRAGLILGMIATGLVAVFVAAACLVVAAVQASRN